MNQSHNIEREISPRTKLNFWLAKTRTISTRWGVLMINWFTDKTRVFPQLTVREPETWWTLEQSTYQVLVTRLYWLRFGVALIEPGKETHV